MTTLAEVKQEVRPADREAIIRSLRAGVVPNRGLQHLQVGRKREITTLLQDLSVLASAASFVRFIVGIFGSGKTFLLRLILAIAREKNLVTAQVDLDPSKRFTGTGGEPMAFYKALIASLSTRGKPAGGALRAIVERLLAACSEVATSGGLPIEEAVRERVAPLRDFARGGDVAAVLIAYAKAHEAGEVERKDAAISWLAGEYPTRRSVPPEIGARDVIRDADVYEQIKLLAVLVRLAGYDGLVVAIDEMVTLYKLASPQARGRNFEAVLAIINDLLQGTAPGLGILFGCTPESLADERRGLFSYPAIKSRLSTAPLSAAAMTGPVLHLTPLEPEDLFVLLQKIRSTYWESGGETLLSNEDIRKFMEVSHRQVGALAYQTPRNTIRAFLDLAGALEADPSRDVTKLLTQLKVGGDAAEEGVRVVA